MQDEREEAAPKDLDRECPPMIGARHLSRVFWLSLATAAVSFAIVGAGSASAIQIESFTFQSAAQGGGLLQQAGAHPEQTVATFEFAKDAKSVPLQQARDIRVNLPTGSIGNPQAIPTCTEVQLEVEECPVESQVGVSKVKSVGFGGFIFDTPYSLFNMEPPPGVLAQFGFKFATVTVHLVATVHSLPEYGTTITVRNVPQPSPLFRIENIFWGTPAAASHDHARFGPNENGEFCGTENGETGASCPSHLTEVLPFLTNPSACTPTALAHASVNSWSDPTFAEATAGNEEGGQPIGVTGCAAPPFTPTIEARPSTPVADSPAGLHVKVSLSQHETPEGIAEAQLRDATLLFPEGMTVNPSSAQGLGACTPEEVGLTTTVGDPEARFDETPVSCPDGAKLGLAEIKTQVLENPLKGAMYLAQPKQNPFGTLLGLYLVIEDPTTGVLMKIAGKAVPDQQTGRLAVTFPDAPQFPFEDLDVSLFEGPRAALKTPLACGTYTTGSTMVPWTAPEGPEAHPTDSFPITGSPTPGAPCPTSEAAAPNAPAFKAGVANPAAATYSPFSFRVAREDGSQPIKSLEATLPKGLLGKLAGIPYCSDAALAAAASKSGAAEQASSSCPSASQVGTVNVGAGAGPTPFYTSGKAYLAGPYKGAPLSLAIVTPAVAGPFDLGTVVVRNALNVDPVTTQIHVVSDPIPTILQGIPLDIRSIEVNVDRSQFTLNPTNCSGTMITADTLSVFNQNASLSNPFVTGGCGALGFKPTLKLSLKGKTKRAGNPALTAVLKAPPGEANIARTTVLLPKTQFIDNRHINNPCTRVQFNQGAGNGSACPPKSILGTAVAYSPLLEKPLEGPVYFRSNGGERKLPDLVASLGGQIHVNLVGFIDSVKAGKEGSRVRTRFAEVPDAPVSRFELRLYGGKRGLIQNSRNLCSSKPTATVQMNGQNGKIADFESKIATSCGSKKKRRHSGQQHKKH
jgi:hypothetical protein